MQFYFEEILYITIFIWICDLSVLKVLGIAFGIYFLGENFLQFIKNAANYCHNFGSLLATLLIWHRMEHE